MPIKKHKVVVGAFFGGGGGGRGLVLFFLWGHFREDVRICRALACK